MPRVTDKGDTRAETGDKSNRASTVKLLIEFVELTCETRRRTEHKNPGLIPSMALLRSEIEFT